MITERPLNEKEIKELKQELKSSRERKRSSNLFLVLWILLAIIIGSIASYVYDFNRVMQLMLIGCVAVYILIGVWNYVETLLKEKKKIVSLEYALTKNITKSLGVISEKFIELPQWEDEGTHYLFELEENKILSFGGPDFSTTKSFPTNNFELSLTYGKLDELILLKKYSFGEKIKPIRKIKGQQKWNLWASPFYPDPEKYTIVEGNLNDFIVKLENSINH